MNTFNQKRQLRRLAIPRWELHNESKIIELLNQDPPDDLVDIRGNIDDRTIEFIIEALKNRQVKFLEFSYDKLSDYVIKYLADSLPITNIIHLKLFRSNIGYAGIKCLTDNLEKSCLRSLDIHGNKLGNEGIKYLAKWLRNSKILELKIGSNGISFEGLRYLAEILHETDIISLDLGTFGYLDPINDISDDGLKYLIERTKDTNISIIDCYKTNITNCGIRQIAEDLKETCITSLCFEKNDGIDTSGVQYFTQFLRNTQIVSLDFDCEIDDRIKTIMKKAISQNEERSSKICKLFGNLVAQNSRTYDLEFIIPTDAEALKEFDLLDYYFLIQTFNNTPKIKGHIFHMIIKNNCVDYPHIVEKINEFISKIAAQFNAFIEDKMPEIEKILDNNYDYVSLVQKFENIKQNEIVKNLLFHRALYYVDDNLEILHPYIYKLLNQYEILLYSENLEPDKKLKIISFYQNHQDFHGAKELIDLLQS